MTDEANELLLTALRRLASDDTALGSVAADAYRRIAELEADVARLRAARNNNHEGIITCERCGLRWLVYDPDEYTGTCPRCEVARLREIMDAIDYLRADECSSVEIVNDNADFGGPNSLITVTGDWQGSYEPQAYYGESVADCLRKAVAAKREKENSQRAK